MTTLLTLLTACGGADDEVALAPTPAAGVQEAGGDCGDDGRLQGELFGALQGAVAWGASTLACEGMPRPEGAGARLRFAGALGDANRIAIIIALPTLQPGDTGQELPSTVTIIDEGNGRFFSNAGRPSCWTDIESASLRAPGTSRYVLAGSLYCVAPLAEVNGDADVTISDMEFVGRLDWDAS